MGNKPISAGHAKTGEYVGENRKLYDMSCVKGPQEFAETNASSPTVPLQIIRVVLGVIAYRKWDFRAMNVSRTLLRSEPLKSETCAKPPQWAEKEM